ncbi:Plasmodium RESA N-terminal, putative [Plasmodium ovale]|uniref:Plasmodium RESA N-terminal, putative n=2 Tax=Plasmodium ovale TaxID=36330 RepID=A0A1C3KRB0_PLAOA|nr:Plasmodium RESA N-terminal, putative [Plasmodium ovale]
MQKNMSIINILLMFILLNSLLLNVVCMSKFAEATESKLIITCKNKLVSLISNIIAPTLEETDYDNQTRKNHPPCTSKLTLECKENSIVKELTKDELLEKLDLLCSDVGKKKLGSALFYYNNYLHLCCNEMIRKLWKTYKQLLIENNIPEEEGIIYWMDCKKSLTSELNTLSEVYRKYYHADIEAEDLGKTGNCRLFLQLCNWLGNYDKKYKEKKWTKLLNEKMINHHLSKLNQRKKNATKKRVKKKIMERKVSTG